VHLVGFYYEDDCWITIKLIKFVRRSSYLKYPILNFVIVNMGRCDLICWLRRTV